MVDVAVTQGSCCTNVAPMFLILLIMFGIFFGLIAVAIKTLIFCMISSKAGYSWALGLLILVPIVSIIFVLYLAFADWPVQKELRSLKQK